MAKKNDVGAIKPKDICGICGKPILEKDPFPYLDDTYRHRACGPGSKAWTAKHGLSKIGALLQKKVKEPTPKRKSDPIRQAVKEFCGREKYMRYMDSVNKSIECHWRISAMIGGKEITHSRDQGAIDPELLYQQLTKGGK